MHWIALQPLPDPSRPAGGTTPDPDGPPALADAITALGWWALNFTPKVARLEDTVVLEVSASERLWGGRQQLLCQMFESTKAITDVQ
jgi:protein ImuB